MAGEQQVAGMTSVSVVDAIRGGIIHTPVTPFDESGATDFDRFADVIRFHVHNGAQALALPLDVGEGLSLRESERGSLVEHAVDEAGDIPVIADVSQAGTALSASLAVRAEEAGAAAIIVTTPFFYRPPEEDVIRHFESVASATRLPVLLHSSPRAQARYPAPISPAMVEAVVERASNVVGIVDGSRNWISFAGLRRRTLGIRPDFLLLVDAEYLTPTMSLGGDGALSSLSAIAPLAVAELHRMTSAGEYIEARALQQRIGRLWKTVAGSWPSSVKAAMKLMGRDTGRPRLPNLPLANEALASLRSELRSLGVLDDEPTGW